MIGFVIFVFQVCGVLFAVAAGSAAAKGDRDGKVFALVLSIGFFFCAAALPVLP